MPQQQRWQLDSGPDTSLLAEELQAQWHEQLNMHLGNILITPGSNRKVWWLCDQCPDGLPHIWEAAVLKRTYGRGCPFCSGNTICQHNALARKAPEVALLWDATKNHLVSPDQVTVFSSMKAHWKCSACLHEWQAQVSARAVYNTGCPKCAQAHPGRAADGTRQKHPTSARAKHALLDQWDHDRNRENGIFLTTRHYAAVSSFGGSAMNAQKARCTAGRLAHTIEPPAKSQQDALAVLGTSFVSVILWQQSVLILLLILTLNRTVPLRLK